MITERQITIAKALISTGLLDCVYHSVELVQDDKGVKFPAYNKGAEQIYIGPDDAKKMFAYIRQNGATTKLEEKLIGSCSKMYKMAVPTRVVIFQDHCAEDFDKLTNKLLAIIFLKEVSFTAYNNNAFQLAKQESPAGDFAFDATTFYLAIDVVMKFWITTDNCPEENCIAYPNPICS